ncbi:RNA methyltransferase, TrmH family [Gracilibacillus ureilyticus]|uniref:RNA methyltransferase, TrmH family n=1 Tax=Gracilibacillus ureilyticus TaxID=531814 RepID=A0A1H9UG41_9BACI|nr:RNA methyltransferase [Gracilibacillus ureilyticus]SES08238.1 RNA methyltransferase, TrmH family [Gracilibacillus ureilyticus]
MITSVKNEKVKEWRKLKQKKERDIKGEFLIEGYHLIEEAHKSDWEIAEIIYEDEKVDVRELSSYDPVAVSDNVMAAITDTRTPQGIAAVVKKKQFSRLPVKKALLIDNVQDPGNVGTMIRTADAAGFDTVMLGKGTVDLYNEKVIRATQGSLFHLNILEADLETEMDRLMADGVTVWSTGLEKASPYHEMQVPEKVAIIVGNEGSGVSAELMEKAEQNVLIPIFGKAESLNVSIAAAILMYYVTGNGV